MLSQGSYSPNRSIVLAAKSRLQGHSIEWPTVCERMQGILQKACAAEIHTACIEVWVSSY